MKTLIYIFLLFGFITSCKKDFIVEDIKDKTLIVRAPADSLVTSVNSITFWWESLSGAEKYNLQIVKPNFGAIAQLVADTNVTGDKITLSLNPGKYQWRIKAFNNGGSTAYQTFNLTIDSTTVLTNQLIVPISPLSGLVTSSKTFTFSWNPLTAASSYSIEISQNNSVIHYSTTPSPNYIYTFSLTAAANYTCSWRVRALNATSISQYNTAQTFTIDLSPPSAVSTPTYPMSNPVIRDTFELRWNRSSIDTQFDSLYIYGDAGLSNLVRVTSVSTNTIKINQISPNNPLSAGASSATAIPYWWRLKSVDQAGNTTGFSTSLNFQLTQ